MDKVLSIRSIRSICQMEKSTIYSTGAVVDRKIASIGKLHLISDNGDPVKVLSIRSIRSICQMEKFPIDSTSAVVDRTIASH